MATRSSPIDLWDIVRGIQRRLHALETARGAGPDADWIYPTLLNGWVRYDAIFETARYRKLSSGQVEIQGLVKNGTTPVIFTLPVGYRPTGQLILPTTTNSNVFARLDIAASGDVSMSTGSNAWFSINCTFYPG